MYGSSLLVEIIVETTDAEEKYEIATGYPVAKDLVITAHHALFPKDEQGKHKTVRNIHLRWYYQKGEAGKRLPPLKPDCVVWNGYEKLGVDVVLLECTFPEAVNGVGYLSKSEWQSGTRWESEGFAKSGQFDNARPPTELWGTMPNPGDADKSTFTIGVDYETGLKTGWKGASGSPVMLASGEIVGIIESSLNNFDGKRFEATSVRALLKDPDFRKRTGYDQREKLTKRAKKQLLGKLQGNDDAVRQLDDCLAPDDEHIKSDAEIVDALLALPHGQALNVLNKARYNLLKEGKPGADCILDLLHILLPAVFESEYNFAELVRSKKDGFRYSVLELPIATKTVAEIIMAAVDMRTTAFKPLAKGAQLPEGRYLISLPPESGRDESGDHYIRNVDLHLMKKFPGQFRRRIIDDKELVGADAASLPEPEKVKIALDTLEYLATEHPEPHTHYYLYILPEGDVERRYFKRIIEKLQKTYQAIAFINLSGYPNQYQPESKPLKPLAHLLRSQPQTQENKP